MADDPTNARLVTLTDGVLAIAMTLLVLDIRLPGSAEEMSDGALWAAVVGIWPQIFSYGLSFLVIANLWLTHVQKFRHVQRSSPTLIRLHILFLLAVGLVPFTTSLLAESGNSVSTAIYAGEMAFASLLLGLIAVHVDAAGLAQEPATHGRLRLVMLSQLGATVVFGASAGIAFISPSGAKYFWLLLIPLAFVRERRRPSQA
jgi:uncharacterized membrane protein